jgi:hypothetical protein
MRAVALPIIAILVLIQMQEAFSADAPLLREKRGHAYRVKPQPYPYPLACEAVKFPRSPLCAGRPYRPSPYGRWL